MRKCKHKFHGIDFAKLPGTKTGTHCDEHVRFICEKCGTLKYVAIKLEEEL